MAMHKAFTDPELLQKQVDEYFQHCEATAVDYEMKAGAVKRRQELPSMVGLALWLGVSRDTLYSYMNQERKVSLTESQLKAMSDTLTYAKDKVEESVLNAALAGDVDSRIASLILYQHGYTNKATEDQTIVVKVETSNGVDASVWSR